MQNLDVMYFNTRNQKSFNFFREAFVIACQLFGDNRPHLKFRAGSYPHLKQSEGHFGLFFLVLFFLKWFHLWCYLSAQNVLEYLNFCTLSYSTKPILYFAVSEV